MTAVTLAVLRAIMRLYPARFRDRFAADVVASVRLELERASLRGRTASLRTAAAALADALGGLLPEHGAQRGPVHFHGGLIDDVRHGIRSLRQAPTFTTVALVVLSLGIGAGTAIFSVVDALVLRGLPFDEPDRIVAVLEHNPKRPVRTR